MSTLTEVTSEMVIGSSAGAKNVAEQVGKAYHTLMRELNEDDQHAKLGANLILPLMSACDSVAPLEHLARRTGFRLVSIASAKADKPVQEKALDLLPALSRFVGVITNDSTRDHHAAFLAMKDLIQEVEEAYDAFRVQDRRSEPRFR